jgi:putrescine aminotransferase
VTPGGLKHSFFCNSGAEAVEGALKLVRIATGKEPVIYCKGAFHGKSFGALSVTGREKYQKPFAPLLHNFSSVPYDDLEALEKALSIGEAAAVILEPIQGEGGIIIPSDGYLRGVRELCDKYNTYMIVDEIQTGFGRTGYMFACEKEGVEPDVMCVAKSLGGGVMPIGAYITTEELWNKAYGSVEKCLLHTSTFGGNAMATSAGIAALEVIINNDLPQKAKENGEYFIGKLRELKEKYPIIRDVRGMGLMIGLEFEEPVKKGSLAEKLGGKFLNKLSGEYMGALIAGELLNKHHIITAYTLNNPNVIRLEPPLTVCRQDLDKVLEALEEIFQSNSGLFSLAMSSGKNILGRVFKR